MSNKPYSRKCLIFTQISQIDILRIRCKIYIDFSDASALDSTGFIHRHRQPQWGY